MHPRKSPSYRNSTAVAVAAMLSVQAIRLRADSNWQLPGGSSGDWFNAANWSNGVPGAGDVAFIDNGGQAQITSGSPVANGLDVGAGSSLGGSLSIFGATLSIGDGGVAVGNNLGGSHSALAINSASSLIDSGPLDIGPTGFVDLNQGSLAAASITVNGGSLGLYNFAAGANQPFTPISSPSMTIEGGGAIDFDCPESWVGISGSTLLTGAGSGIETAFEDIFQCTDGAQGGLQVEDGAQLSAWNLVIGDLPGDSASMTISGTGTLVNTQFEDLVSGTRLTVTQTGGTNIASTMMEISTSPGASCQYSMSGGILQTPTLCLNFIKFGTDNFALSGSGIVQVSGTEYIGLGGTANFIQSDGSNTVGSLLLGSAAATFPYDFYITGAQSIGNYTLAGGTLQASSLDVGNGSGCTGTYIQTSGTASFSATNIAVPGESFGELDISGGSANLGNLNIAGSQGSVSVCDISGGQVQVANLAIASGAESAATFTLSDASLNPQFMTLAL